MKYLFEFGPTVVEIRQGNILKPGIELDAIASPDDNYLSMGLGLAGRLAGLAGNQYRREAQLQGPIAVGSVVQTQPHGLRPVLDIRAVIHAAAIDYDGKRVPLEQSVARATTSCLAHAERQGLHRILMPAFGTGAGKLDKTTGARAMCGAIKEFLAVHRELNYVGIILFVPDREPDEPEEDYQRRATAAAADNEPFVRAANLILGTPYDPARPDPQIRDFHARDDELGRVLNALQSGEVRHVAVLGGPRMGKTALLAQVLDECRKLAADGEPAPRLVPVTFGQVHENTPGSFIYRKMLLALAADEADADQVSAIRERYADPDMTWQLFAEFLEADPERYSGVVFVIDDLPRLLAMDPRDVTKEPPAFWSDLQDLERLGGRIRLLFTATGDESYTEVLGRLAPGYTSSLTEVRLGPVSETAREEWTEEALERYLHRRLSDSERDLFLDDLIGPEGGRHPFLISVALHTMIRDLNEAALGGTGTPSTYDAQALRAVRVAVERAIEGTQFFDDLLGRMHDGELLTVKLLAELTALQAEEARLTRRIADDAQARSRFGELQPRKRDLIDLLGGRLEPLEKLGCVVGTDDTARPAFVSASVERYMHEYSGIGVAGGRSDEQVTVEIMVTRFDPARIRVQLLGRGAHAFSTLKPVSEEDEVLFRRDFDAFLNPSGGGKQAFRSINEVGNHVLNRFVSGSVKKLLIEAARKRTTIDFVVGRELEAIPWELIVETVYEDADELPFRMGRRVISGTEPAPIGEVRKGNGKIRALLIGNPTGDLPAAEDEVEAIRERLLRDGRFEVTLLGPGPSSTGPASKRNVLRELATQGYALIHYSGHSHQQREQSAWRLRNEDAIELLTTSDLTNFLQMAPPALVFSSSCESGKAEGGEEHPIEYENQAFDLPGAVLQAGVPTYIGTLWNVADSSACAFSTRFYEALLEGTETLGECIRVAKNAVKEFEGERGVPTWPAFVLYGDPEITPDQVYPLLGENGGAKR